MRFIPYSHQSLDDKDLNEVIKALRSDWITQGPKIREFETALCRYTGARYAVAVSSGTAALHIACLAAGIKRGDEVITSPITFIASSNAVLYCAGKPVFADIKDGKANINISDIKNKITLKTKAIMPVHFAGHPCHLQEIYKIAKEHNLFIIEDACHALGAVYKGTKIGSCKYSHMTVFSFHPAKSITTGEGGAVLTNKQDIYEKLLLLRNHGITKDKSRFVTRYSDSDGSWLYEMQELGFNYRITDFQCALGLGQLKKLDRLIGRRREIAGIYNDRLSEISGIDLPQEEKNVKSAWHLYSIRVKNTKLRKVVFNKLRSFGIGAQVHYIPVYRQPYYKQLGYKAGLCPNAEDFYRKEISIPLYPDMSGEDIEYVINNMLRVFQNIRCRK